MDYVFSSGNFCLLCGLDYWQVLASQVVVPAVWGRKSNCFVDFFASPLLKFDLEYAVCDKLSIWQSFCELSPFVKEGLDDHHKDLIDRRKKERTSNCSSMAGSAFQYTRMACWVNRPVCDLRSVPETRRMREQVENHRRVYVLRSFS
jgi:hypothetical protein